MCKTRYLLSYQVLEGAGFHGLPSWAALSARQVLCSEVDLHRCSLFLFNLC